MGKHNFGLIILLTFAAFTLAGCQQRGKVTKKFKKSPNLPTLEDKINTQGPNGNSPNESIVLDVSDINVDKDNPVATIPVTLSGLSADGAVCSSAYLSCTSSNTAVVECGESVTWGGTWPECTAVFLPIPYANGTSEIQIKATDGSKVSMAQAFTLKVTHVNEAPLLASMSDASVDEDTPTSAIPLTISDADGPSQTCNSNFLFYTTSNSSLVASTGALTWGGTWPNCTAVVNPSANASGSSTIEITAHDGSEFSSTKSFTLSVSALNDVPSIGSITNHTTDEDTATGTIAVTVSDVDGPAQTCNSTYLSYTSSNTSLISSSGAVTWGGTWPSCTAIITPTANAYGTSTIEFTASDTTDTSAPRSFTLTVNSLNDVPSLAALSNTSVNKNTPTSPIAVTVSDADGPAQTCNSTYLSYTSSNSSLVATSGAITWGGTWPNCTAVITPTTNASGISTLEVTANDGTTPSAAQSFSLTVNAIPVYPKLWTNKVTSTQDHASLGALNASTAIDSTNKTIYYAARTWPHSSLGSERLLLSKFDYFGNRLATKILSTTNKWETIVAMYPLADGSIFLAINTTSSDLRWMKLSADLNTIVWQFRSTDSKWGTGTYDPSTDRIYFEFQEWLSPYIGYIDLATGAMTKVLVTRSTTYGPTSVTPLITSSGKVLFGLSSSDNSKLVFMEFNKDLKVSGNFDAIRVIEHQMNYVSRSIILVESDNYIASFGAHQGDDKTTIGLFRKSDYSFVKGAHYGVQPDRLGGETLSSAYYHKGEFVFAGSKYYNPGWRVTKADEELTKTISHYQDMSATSISLMGGGGPNYDKEIGAFALPFFRWAPWWAPADVTGQFLVFARANYDSQEALNYGTGLDFHIVPASANARASSMRFVNSFTRSYTFSETPPTLTSSSTTISNETDITHQTYILNTTAPVPNLAPALSSITDTTTDEDTNSLPVLFTITDSDGPAQTCSAKFLDYSSSNTTLVGNSGAITWGGTWPNCTAVVSPIANASGTAVISIVANDGAVFSNMSTFTLTVDPVNDAPVLASLTDHSTTLNTVSAGIVLEITDIDGPLQTCSSTFLTYASSASSIVAGTGAVTWGGTWPNCTASVTPQTAANGLSTLQFTVNDGSESSNTQSLTFAVNGAIDHTKLWTSRVTSAQDFSSVGDQSATTAMDTVNKFVYHGARAYPDISLGPQRILLSRFDYLGNLLASKSISVASTYESVSAIIPLSDGSVFIVIGTIYSDMRWMKLSADLSTIAWQFRSNDTRWGGGAYDPATDRVYFQYQNFVTPYVGYIEMSTGTMTKVTVTPSTVFTSISVNPLVTSAGKVLFGLSSSDGLKIVFMEFNKDLKVSSSFQAVQVVDHQINYVSKNIILVESDNYIATVGAAQGNNVTSIALFNKTDYSFVKGYHYAEGGESLVGAYFSNGEFVFAGSIYYNYGWRITKADEELNTTVSHYRGGTSNYANTNYNNVFYYLNGGGSTGFDKSLGLFVLPFWGGGGGSSVVYARSSYSGFNWVNYGYNLNLHVEPSAASLRSTAISHVSVNGRTYTYMETPPSLTASSVTLSDELNIFQKTFRLNN